MGGRKKLTNNTDIPQHQIEAIARCILPDILAFYESEEGQRKFSLNRRSRENGEARGKNRIWTWQRRDIIRKWWCPALFVFMWLSSLNSVAPLAWRQTCALPRCESRYFHTDRKKPIIRTHLLLETSSDYIGLVPVVGLEPTRGISPTDFESVTSANSITPARMGYYIILAWRRQYPGWGFLRGGCPPMPCHSPFPIRLKSLWDRAPARHTSRPLGISTQYALAPHRSKSAP